MKKLKKMMMKKNRKMKTILVKFVMMGISKMMI